MSRRKPADKVKVMIGRLATHALLLPRWRTNQEIRQFARTQQSGRVLEIGSGKPVNGKYPYSAADLFDCEVVRSDIDPVFGHPVVDVMSDDLSGFDAILCANVLEHVPDPQAAVDNMRKGLPDGGRVFAVVPFAYPLHDEPGDYWRFTEHALRRLFDGFSRVD